MYAAFKFLINNLNYKLIFVFTFALSLNINSYINHLQLDKELTIKLPKIITKLQDFEASFPNELITILMQNFWYLTLYTVTLFIIESIGKLAVRNAVNKTYHTLLNADLNSITKKDYEYTLTSIIHNEENLLSCINNLFIEFPRKIIASLHFIIALYQLSFTIMLYCLLANLLFIVFNMIIMFARKHLSTLLLQFNTKFTIICSDLSNSIQTYKIDDRLQEYTTKINNLSYSKWYIGSLDSVLVGLNDAATNFSSQLMICLIAYMCRPMIINRAITIENLSYGIRSSSKFVEKLTGISEYIGNVIRQYQSFTFFDSTNITVTQESQTTHDNLSSFQISTPNSNSFFDLHNSNLIRINGVNGVGKTSLLLQFLGVCYFGATSTGCIIPLNKRNAKLLPSAYKHQIAFVQQLVPLTYDSIEQYIKSVTQSSCSVSTLLTNMLEHFNIDISIQEQIFEFFESIDIRKQMRELSGGQAKLIQFLTAILKLYTLNASILILDEPSNNLDVSKISIIKHFILSCLRHRITIFIVTHDERMTTNLVFKTITL